MDGVVAVTGATGFIGRHACRLLLEDGWEVVGLVRPESPRPLPPGVERRVARLRVDELGRPLVDADLVVHLAGVTRADGAEAFRRVNRDGTREVGVAAAERGLPLLYVSSQAAAGPGTVESPRTEDDPAEPASPYGVSKLEGERALAAIAGLRFAVVRPCSVFGPGDRDFLALFRLVRRGLFPRLGPGGAAYSFCHVDDVARSIVLAAARLAGEAPPGGDAAAAASSGAGAAAVSRSGRRSMPPALVGEVVHVAHPRPLRERQLAAALGAAVGREPWLVRVPGWALRAAAAVAPVALPNALHASRLQDLRAGSWVLSTDKARHLLGFEAAVDVEEGLRSTARWYRDHGWM